MLANSLPEAMHVRSENSGDCVLRNVSRTGLLFAFPDCSCKHGGRPCATISWIITGTIV